LAAVIALLCVSSTVLAHDIYSNLRDRDGHLCCNGQDCKPVEVRVLSDGNYYLPETDETIPAMIASTIVPIIKGPCWQMSLTAG
jgi:hypothetical protein